MPLHLLPQKSWNVYSAANVARVRRDEADARLREQREQDAEAAARIALLRNGGEQVENTVAAAEQLPKKRLKRKRGEDETEREMRWAQEKEGEENSKMLLLRARDGEADANAPLQDENGNFALFPRLAEKRRADVEAEEEKARDQKTLRFRTADRRGAGATAGAAAAGGGGGGEQKPWYASATAPARSTSNATATRLTAVAVSMDPFAAMQSAQKQLKQSAREREAWRVDRAAPEGLARLDAGAEEKTKHRHRHRHSRRHRDQRDSGEVEEKEELDSLEGFSLDATSESKGVASACEHTRRPDRSVQSRHPRRDQGRSRSPDSRSGSGLRHGRSEDTESHSRHKRQRERHRRR